MITHTTTHIYLLGEGYDLSPGRQDRSVYSSIITSEAQIFHNG